MYKMLETFNKETTEQSKGLISDVDDYDSANVMQAVKSATYGRRFRQQ
jgi:hypothetical protein